MAKKEKTEVKEKAEKDGKAAALKLALEKINKNIGKGAVIRLGDKVEEKVEVIPTGSLTLDLALGVGGYPRGRIIEIFGPESSGKTTLTLHAFDPSYARKLGVNTDDLYVSQPDNGEQALEIADTFVRSGGADLIVIDSVAALTPKTEIEGEMGDSKMGVHARLMSQALRKITGSIKKANCIVMFINQLRDKIGVMFGSPETTTGGNALKFYSSIRIDIRRSLTPIKDKDGNAIGNATRVKVVKNKVAPPFQSAEFDVMYGEGISKSGEIIDLGVDYDILSKSGAWYSYGDMKLGNGRDATKTLLLDNPELMEEIENKIKEVVKAGAPKATKGKKTKGKKGKSQENEVVEEQEEIDEEYIDDDEEYSEEDED